MIRKSLFLSSTLLFLAVVLASPQASAQEKKHDVTLKGEIVDLMCYLDHGGKGEKHAGCAKTCIESGGPVGLLTASGELYLVIGEHKPMNDKLAAYAAKEVTLKGDVAERNGVKLLENTTIVQ